MNCSVILNQPRNYFSVFGPLEKSGGGGGGLRSGKSLLQHAIFFFYLMEILVLLYMQLNRMILPNSVHS